ncbi:type II secretion system F family protein [Aeromonas hydrophila]|uniref:hypothetical protein n=1 Tax=Aeromonas hydrophila TaxID=644 RepID=UPI002B4A52B6|nr:hypothetical protein [Aeromonas hydrophila]
MIGEQFNFTKFFFRREQQIELIENYISLKVSNNRIMKDRDLLIGLKDLYKEEYGESNVTIKIISLLLEKITEGVSLPEAMGPYFRADIVQVFSASYNSRAGFDEVRGLIQRIISGDQLVREFLSSISFPVFFLFVAIGMFLFVGGFFVPMTIEMIEKDAIDSVLHFSMGVSSFVIGKWYFAILPFVVLVWLYAYSKQNWFSDGRNWADNHLPPYQVMALLYSYNIFGILSMLSSSGIKSESSGTKISIRKAIETMLDTATPYASWHLKQMLDMTSGGVFGLLQLETGLLPTRLKMRLRVSQLSGVSDQTQLLAIIASESFGDFKKALEKPKNLIRNISLAAGATIMIFSLYAMFVSQMLLQTNMSM